MLMRVRVNAFDTTTAPEQNGRLALSLIDPTQANRRSPSWLPYFPLLSLSRASRSPCPFSMRAFDLLFLLRSCHSSHSCCFPRLVFWLCCDLSADSPWLSLSLFFPVLLPLLKEVFTNQNDGLMLLRRRRKGQ